MNSLLTGATGFAGSHLAEHLLAQGDRVLGVSRQGVWPAAMPDALRAAVPLVAWDVADERGPPEEARRTIEGFAPAVVYHLAAESVPAHCDASDGNPSAEWDAERINVGGTLRAIELCLTLPSRPRLVFAGSSHVYARQAAEAPPVSEDAPLEPWRAYGRTKLAAEEAIRAACRERGLDAVIARAFQHAGPRQRPEMMLAEWARQLARSESPLRVRNLTTRLDLTDVRDVVRAYRLLAERGQTGEAYNVGSGVAVTSGQVLELLKSAAAAAPPVEERDPGERFDPIADATRLTTLTGWRPEIPLPQTVADTLADWRRRAAGA